jgi:multiple sugar transport system substrate-binding protein
MQRLTTILGLVLLIALGAGVGIARTPTVAASKGTAATLHGTVTFWNAYSPDEEKVLTTKVIPAFEHKYPGVHVNNLTLPYDGMFTKLLTAIAGGTAPDVVRSDIIWVPQLASLHALVPLDRLKWFRSYARSVFKGPLATNYWHGHYYGLPLDTNTRVLIYNKTVFKEAGLSSPPSTVFQFLADCKKIKALGKNIYCYAEGGTDAWNVLPWIWSFGGGITDSHYRKATGYLDSKGTIAAINFLVDLLHSGYLSPSILGGGIATSDCLGKGLCAMILDGPWMVPIFQGAYPQLQYGMSLIPRGPGGSVSVVGGEDIVLSNQSRNKAASEAFIRFMLSKQAQTWMGQIGQMPVLKALAHSSALPSYFGIFQHQLKSARPRTPSPRWTQIDDAISTAVQKALRGQGSPQSLLKEAAQKVNQLLH